MSVSKFLHLATEGWTVVAAGLGGVLTLLLGSWVPLMTTLLIVQGVDVVTGVMVGKQDKSVASAPFFAGMKKKVGMWALVILGNLIDGIAFAGMPVAKTAVVSFLIAGEGLSVTENLAVLGVPIPKFITDYLQKLKDDSDDTTLPDVQKEETDDQ